MTFTKKDFRLFHRNAKAEFEATRTWWERAKIGAPERMASDIECLLQALKDDVDRYARLLGEA
jgi:hypothetical protein